MEPQRDGRMTEEMPLRIDPLAGLPRRTVFQIHTGKVPKDGFVRAIEQIPGGIDLSIDLSQKRRFHLDGQKSKAETKKRHNYDKPWLIDHGESQIVGIGNTVYVAIGESDVPKDTFDHVLRPNSPLNLDALYVGGTMGIGARAIMQVDEITPYAVRGHVISCHEDRRKIYENDGFTRPNALNVRAADEPQLSEIDLEYLNAIPEDKRQRLTNVAISFASDPEKIKAAIETIRSKGYDKARVALKVETVAGLKALEDLAKIPDVDIVFACGDLGEAAAELGADLHGWVKNGARKLKRLRENKQFGGQIFLAYGFGEESGDDEIKREISGVDVDVQARHRLHARLERITGRDVGMWFTGVGMKQESVDQIRRLIHGTLFKSAKYKDELDMDMRAALEGSKNAITKKEIAVLPTSVEELRQVLFARGYGPSGGSRHAWLEQTNQLFENITGSRDVDSRTVLKLRSSTDMPGGARTSNELIKESRAAFLRILRRREADGAAQELREIRYEYDDAGRARKIDHHLGVPAKRALVGGTSTEACMRVLTKELGIDVTPGSGEYMRLSQLISAVDTCQDIASESPSQRFFGITSRYVTDLMSIEMPEEYVKEDGYVEYDDKGRIKSKFIWVPDRGDGIERLLKGEVVSTQG